MVAFSDSGSFFDVMSSQSVAVVYCTPRLSNDLKCYCTIESQFCGFMSLTIFIFTIIAAFYQGWWLRESFGFLFCCYVFFPFFFKQELPVLPKLASNLRSSCPGLLCIGIKDFHPFVQLCCYQSFRGIFRDIEIYLLYRLYLLENEHPCSSFLTWEHCFSGYSNLFHVSQEQLRVFFILPILSNFIHIYLTNIAVLLLSPGVGTLICRYLTQVFVGPEMSTICSLLIGTAL